VLPGVKGWAIREVAIQIVQTVQDTLTLTVPDSGISLYLLPELGLPILKSLWGRGFGCFPFSG
jgi:hypothetical protein